MSTLSSTYIGKVIQVAGPAVDIQFDEGHLPVIRTAIRITSDGFNVPTPIDVICEVAQHIGESRVRTIALQPTEDMHMEMHVRAPGLGMQTLMVSLNATYRQADEKPLEAYQALLLDVIRGDKTLFIRFDEVEWAWRVVDPIQKAWAQDKTDLRTYPAGTWGPDTDKLFDCHDQEWRND